MSADDVLRSAGFRAALDASVDTIRGAAGTDSEATLAAVFDREVADLIERVAGARPRLDKETPVDSERRVGRGRTDSRFGAVVLEYKRPHRLDRASERDRAQAQLQGYLVDLEATTAAASRHEFAGALTDGVTFQFCLCGQGAVRWGAAGPLAARHLRQLVEAFVGLERVALTGANLIRDFCTPTAGRSPARQLFEALLDSLSHHRTARTTMLLEEWQRLFRLSHDDTSKQRTIKERRQELEEVAGETFARGDILREYQVLFCLQTAYAILVKSIAHAVLARQGRGLALDLRSLVEADDRALYDALRRWEEGRLFREAGIHNLLEGDFFLWYCASPDAWTTRLARAIRDVVAILVPYDGRGVLQTLVDDDQTDGEDIFQELYTRLMPPRVRHSLGEFYTPHWLAETVVDEAVDACDAPPQWRGLDPCCGSGTFLSVMLNRVLHETAALDRPRRLTAVLQRVQGIDLNPVAVLSARVNYFLHIAHLLAPGDEVEIPVLLGDASYVPETATVDGVELWTYQIATERGPLPIRLPKYIVGRGAALTAAIPAVERSVHARDAEAAAAALLAVAGDEPPPGEAAVRVTRELADRLVELEEADWNGLWTRIAVNFLRTAELGRFDVVVGNPPWIDWKNLPDGYRERIKGLCIDRHLFSGDRLVGGINLNICALIANVAAERWLADTGCLALLMPEPMVFQQTYEGWRDLRLSDGRLYFQRFVDWTRAGHPFFPVTQRFLTYVLSRAETDPEGGLPELSMRKRRGTRSLRGVPTATRFADVEALFDRAEGVLGQSGDGSTAFVRASSRAALRRMSAVRGHCAYIGREGIEFYPQELFLHRVVDGDHPAPPGLVWVHNIQNPRSKYRLPERTLLLEAALLHPMVKGPEIGAFRHDGTGLVVPFPYDPARPRVPIPAAELARSAPRLYDYLRDNKAVIDEQTNYNERIMGRHATEFYALARVGAYTFAPFHVGYRDNTRWGAAVFGAVDTPWGGPRLPLFQNHAASIAEHESGRFITEDEAHYLCAIFNAPTVFELMMSSSDTRTFKVRPPIEVPEFDPADARHRRLAELSRRAHRGPGDPADSALDEMDTLYRSLL